MNLQRVPKCSFSLRLLSVFRLEPFLTPLFPFSVTGKPVFFYTTCAHHRASTQDSSSSFPPPCCFYFLIGSSPLDAREWMVHHGWPPLFSHSKVTGYSFEVGFCLSSSSEISLVSFRFFFFVFFSCAYFLFWVFPPKGFFFLSSPLSWGERDSLSSIIHSFWFGPIWQTSFFWPVGFFFPTNPGQGTPPFFSWMRRTSLETSPWNFVVFLRHGSRGPFFFSF